MKLSHMESYLAHRDPGGLAGLLQAVVEWLPVSPSKTMVTFVVVAPTATPSR
jgi:hypothetical protein